MVKKITVLPRGGVVGVKPPVAPTPRIPPKPPITRNPKTGSVIITPEYEAWMKAMQEAGRTREVAPAPVSAPRPSIKLPAVIQQEISKRVEVYKQPYKLPTPAPGEAEAFKAIPGQVYKGLQYYYNLFKAGVKTNILKK